MNTATFAQPFIAMGDTPHAATLAHCILAATTPEEIWPCMRLARRLTGQDVGPYLDGACFVGWVDEMGEPTDLDALKVLAARYLGEEL